MKTCSRCLMDTSAQDIIFDDKGFCNYCSTFLERLADPQIRSQIDNQEAFISKIKSDGKGKKYDCIIGVSGGVDSSYALHLAVKNGLRPLAVHMDNGWNSELANNNIEQLIRKTGVDFYTHVIDWNEYKALMNAFFDANIIDIELLYDNAMLAVNYKMAKKFGVKYILSGNNTSSEGMAMPANWNWFKMDKRNIKNIAKTRNVKIKTFPIIGTLSYLYYRLLRRIQWVSFLDYFDYDKAKAMSFLKENYGYKPYPYKHYESVFTRFYQGYLLPEKFGVDKRKLHLSSLICSKQLTRAEGEKMMKKSPYPSEIELEQDKSFFLKKMNWSNKMLEDYLSKSEVSHLLYGSEKYFFDFFLNVYQNYFK